MTFLDRALRDFSRLFDWVPFWAVTLMTFAFCAIVAFYIHVVAFRLLTRVIGSWSLFWRSLITRTLGPTRMAFVIIGLVVATRLSPLSPSDAETVRHILQVGLVVLAGWVAQTAIHIWMTIYLRRFKLDADDNLLARKHVTQSRILLRVADIMILILTISAALMTFENVRQYGVSLLASAGAAGIIVGLALQPVLKNLLAGIQLAITQPIRIDDALLVEGEWGRVEEITSTYVVVKIWDLRRLVLPLSYFIEQPFQNWTRESASLLGNVMIYLDYRAPIAAIREKVREIVQASPLWDGEVVGLQVTDFREHTMEVRILASASNAGRTFDLRCHIREHLVAFLQSEHPEALPHFRIQGESLTDARTADRAPIAAPSLA